MLKRYSRISQLSEHEELQLIELVNETPGMTIYGHRARTAVMLPLPLAREVAQRAKMESISIGQAIVNMLNEQLEELQDSRT